MNSDKLNAAVGRATLVLASIAFAYALCVNIVVVGLAGPQEYREAAMPICTEFFAHGHNLYALSNQPVYANMYGIGYHLLMAPLARLFGSTLLIHRLVSMFFTLAACALLAIATWRITRSRQFAWIAFALFYCDIASRCADLAQPALPETILARPDAMALAFFLGSVFWPMWKNYSTRSLIGSIVLGLMALMTKPYLMIGPALVAAYLFVFVDKRRGLALAGGFLLGVALVLAAATMLMPCYFANVVTGSRSAGGQSNPQHLYAQLKTYLFNSPGIIVISIAASFTGVWTLRRAGGFKLVFLRPGRLPLVRYRASFPAFAAACAFAVLYCKLGRFTGNSMVYFHHLLSPFLLLVVFGYIAQTPLHRKWIPLSLVIVDLLLFPLSAGRPPSAHADVWREWDGLLASHRNIYAPPPLAGFLLRQGKPIYDTGLSDAYLYAMESPLYPARAVMQDRYRSFVSALGDQVEREQLDLIVLPYHKDEPWFCFLPTDLLQRHYKPVATLSMPMDWQQGWVGLILEPRGKISAASP